ncbi:MAG: DUF2639 domain-containing protein [Lysinibacillus sp.]
MIAVHMYSKGWFVKELRARGMMVHPLLRNHLGLYKESELRNLYYKLLENEQDTEGK